MPLVIAACSSGTDFSNTVNRAGCRAEPLGSATTQLATCERCSGVRPSRSGSAARRLAMAVTLAISEPGAGIFLSAPS